MRNTVPVPRHWCFKRKYLQVSLSAVFLILSLLNLSFKYPLSLPYLSFTFLTLLSFTYPPLSPNCLSPFSLFFLSHTPLSLLPVFLLSLSSFTRHMHTLSPFLSIGFTSSHF